MINALIFFALLMILHYSLTILNINANALSLIFFINANTLIPNNDDILAISQLHHFKMNEFDNLIMQMHIVNSGETNDLKMHLPKN